MGAFQEMRIILPLIVLIVGAIVGLLWLEEYLYDRRWTREKILPLYAKVSAMDPDSRKYLDPESLKAWTRGEISIDEIKVLSEAET